MNSLRRSVRLRSTGRSQHPVRLARLAIRTCVSIDELASDRIGDFLGISYCGFNHAKCSLGGDDEVRRAFVAIHGHLFA